jgi:hypothetical protein
VTLPSFSAEASLYETRESYRVFGVGASPSAWVLPAWFNDFDCETLQIECLKGSSWACARLTVMWCPPPGLPFEISLGRR